MIRFHVEGDDRLIQNLNRLQKNIQTIGRFYSSTKKHLWKSMTRDPYPGATTIPYETGNLYKNVKFQKVSDQSYTITSTAMQSERRKILGLKPIKFTTHPQDWDYAKLVDRYGSKFPHEKNGKRYFIHQHGFGKGYFTENIKGYVEALSQKTSKERLDFYKTMFVGLK